MTRPAVGNLGADLFGRARRDGLELFLDPGERARRWWGEGVGVVGGWPGQGQQGGKVVPRHPPGELPEPRQVVGLPLGVTEDPIAPRHLTTPPRTARRVTG